MAKKKEKKEKKAGKRMSKKELAALLIDFFHAKSSETLSMKYIFSELRLTTHPQKMLCVDILHDLLADDYISEIEKGKFRLFLCQTEEQRSRRRSNRNTGTCKRYFRRHTGSSQVIRIPGDREPYTCQ